MNIRSNTLFLTFISCFIYTSLFSQIEVADSLYVEAKKLYGSRNYDQAVQLFEESLELIFSSDSINYNKLARIQFDKAYALYYLNRRTEEIEATHQAIEYMQQSLNPDEVFITQLYTDLAFSSIRDGHFDLAQNYLHLAWSKMPIIKGNKAHPSSTYTSLKLNVLYNYILLYAQNRDEIKMLEHIRLMEEEYQREEIPTNENSLLLASAYNAASEYYTKDASQYKKTLHLLNKAIALIKDKDLDVHKRAYLFNKTKLLFNNKALLEAQKHASDLVTEALSSNDYRLNFFYILASKIERALQDDKKAEAYLSKALLVNRKDSIVIPTLLSDITYILLQPNQSINESRLWAEQAQLYLDKFQLEGGFQHLDIAYHLYQIAANNFSLSKRWDEYSSYMEESSEIILDGLLQSIVLKYKGDINDDDLQLIGYTREDLLWKRFKRKRSPDNRRTSALSDSITMLNNGIIYFEKNRDILLSKNVDSTIAAFKTSREELSKQSNYDYSAKSDVGLTQGAYQNEGLHLPKDKLLLRYFVEESNIYLLSYSANSNHLYYLGSIDSIRPIINSIYADIKVPYSNIEEIKEHAYKLGELLLSPIDLQGVHQLVIVRDNLLNYLPFEILMRNDQYLVEKCNISYTPAISLYLEQLSLPKAKNKKLGIYYKTYENDSKEYAMVRGESLSLKGTKEEALAIHKIFDADLYEDYEVTKSQFLNTAPDYNMLHLATHAVVDDEQNELSHLVLDQTDPMSNLYLDEIRGMYLPADLVVLSACETGIGGIANGNGLQSLSRALNLAGVKSNIVSLWQVPDKESAGLMAQFYEGLKSGNDKSEALANAKRHMIHSEGSSHPYYWASWILSGDESPLFTQSNRYNYLIILALLLIGFFIVFKIKQVSFLSPRR